MYPREKEADLAKEDLRLWGPETPKFSLCGHKCWARVVGIYDADTLTLVIPFKMSVFKYSARLYGIDTCEMKAHDSRCRTLAVKARDRVFELCVGRTYDSSWTRSQLEEIFVQTVCVVWIECGEMDMYGRVLVDVMVNGVSLNKLLLNEKLAYAYDGGKKLTEAEQLAVLGV